MSESSSSLDSRDERAMRALRRAAADAIERARIFSTPLIYADDEKVVKVMPEDLLRENPNLIRELMGNDDPPIGHWGPLPYIKTKSQLRAAAAKND